MKHLGAILIGFIFSFSNNAFALPCSSSGMDVSKANDGSGFIFYIYREKSDIAALIPGKDISFPGGFSGPKQFVIDGIHYEIANVKLSDFTDKPGESDLQVLKKHTAYEQKYIVDSKVSPLTKMVNHGERTKDKSHGQPEFTFYLWQAIDPEDESGPSQFYLSTVTDKEVVLLSAIVKDKDSANRFMKISSAYASTFQHILSKDKCLKK